MTFDRTQTGKSKDERRAAAEARGKGLPYWLRPVTTPEEEARAEYARHAGRPMAARAKSGSYMLPGSQP